MTELVSIRSCLACLGVTHFFLPPLVYLRYLHPIPISLLKSRPESSPYTPCRVVDLQISIRINKQGWDPIIAASLADEMDYVGLLMSPREGTIGGENIWLEIRNDRIFHINSLPDIDLKVNLIDNPVRF